MPGLDKIIARLEADTAAACDAIADEARKNADALIAGANEEGNALIRAAEAAAEKQAEGVLARARSAAALESRRMKLAAKLSAVDGVIGEAKRRFVELPDQAYFDTLHTLLMKNAPEKGGVLYFGKRDLGRLPAAFAASLPAGVTLSRSPADIPAGFILKAGNIDINCTPDALFAAAREPLRAAASEALFGGEG